jgi:endo-1,4-beta-D-glucanase Y
MGGGSFVLPRQPGYPINENGTIGPQYFVMVIIFLFTNSKLDQPWIELMSNEMTIGIACTQRLSSASIECYKWIAALDYTKTAST